MSGYYRRRPSGEERKPSDTVAVSLITGPARVMTLRYAGTCAGIGDAEHAADCPRELGAGVRAVYQRPNVLSLECADTLAPARWAGSPVSGGYVSGLLGRPIEREAGENERRD